MTPELIYDCGDVEPVSYVKSTLIASSRSSLREVGVFADYEKALRPLERDELMTLSMQNTWITIGLARAHYKACDSLPLTPDQTNQLGSGVAGRIASPFIGTAVRIAKSSGVTPWTPLSRLGNSWSRAYKGSGVRVYKLGPKDAEVEVVCNELAAIRYWSTALASLMRGMTEIFAKRAYCRRKRGTEDGVRYLLSWA